MFAKKLLSFSLVLRKKHRLTSSLLLQPTALQSRAHAFKLLLSKGSCPVPAPRQWCGPEAQPCANDHNNHIIGQVAEFPHFAAHMLGLFPFSFIQSKLIVLKDVAYLYVYLGKITVIITAGLYNNAWKLLKRRNNKHGLNQMWNLRLFAFVNKDKSVQKAIPQQAGRSLKTNKQTMKAMKIRVYENLRFLMLHWTKRVVLLT